MAEVTKALSMVAGPEVMAPMMITHSLTSHTKSIFGGVLIAISILLIIIAIIIISAGKSTGEKTAGWMFFILALSGFGFGGYLILHKTLLNK